MIRLRWRPWATSAACVTAASLVTAATWWLLPTGAVVVTLTAFGLAGYWAPRKLAVLAGAPLVGLILRWDLQRVACATPDDCFARELGASLAGGVVVASLVAAAAGAAFRWAVDRAAPAPSAAPTPGSARK